jgi:hypothetical protein
VLGSNSYLGVPAEFVEYYVRVTTTRIDILIHIVRATTPENENSMIILEASGLDGTVLMIGALIDGSSRVLVEKLWVTDVQSKSFLCLFGPSIC